MTEQLKQFLKNFNKQYKCVEDTDDTERILSSIYHGGELPLDSFDRLFALYIIENHPNLLNIDIKQIASSEEYATEIFEALPKEVLDDFNEITSYAYDNYEREGLSQMEAYYNLVNVAKNGKEYTLTDSYNNGGWFGAS